MKIAIIGGGNLGLSIADGLLVSGFVKPTHLTVTRRNVGLLKDLNEKGVNVTTDNRAAVRESDLVILTVKPYQIENIITEIKADLTHKHILISCVTGVSLKKLTQAIGGNTASLYRAMPNTSIAVRESMTCISKGNGAEHDKEVNSLFDQLGISVWIEDELMDAATVLAACGTAFAMRYIRANIQGGIEIGFDAKTASIIAAQTVKGAAELLLQKHTHPEAEIDKVTTPKGCTIAGLNEMEHKGFSSSLIHGIVASFDKISK